MDEKKLAKSVYETACSALTNRDWKYTRHDDDLTLSFGARGDDLPMDFVLMVNPRAQVISLFSPLPYKVAEEKRVEAALAVSVANYGLINGCFDYDLSDGEIRFRMCSSFRDSLIGEELINYMVVASAGTVDDYNDKFLMISKGIWGIEQFIEWEQKKNEKK
jgi:hypothetical protein